MPQTYFFSLSFDPLTKIQCSITHHEKIYESPTLGERIPLQKISQNRGARTCTRKVLSLKLGQMDGNPLNLSTVSRVPQASP